jgi:hypothetical protein
MHDLFIVGTVKNFGSYGNEREVANLYNLGRKKGKRKSNRWKTRIAPSGPGGPFSLEPPDGDHDHGQN